MLIVTYKPFMLSVVMLSVVMLSVMAPPKEPVFSTHIGLPGACSIKLFTLVIDQHCYKLVSLSRQSFSVLV
jgi:hypothetical protein